MSRPLIAILTLSLLGLATQAGAQVLPGGQGRSAGSVRAEYLARVLEGVNETRAQLTEAWNAHDAAALTALFAENASLVPPEGDSWTGRDAIREYLELALLGAGRLETFLLDLDGSHNMAMVVSNFRLEPGVGHPAPVSGVVMSVFVREGRGWLVRSQVFRPSAQVGLRRAGPS